MYNKSEDRPKKRAGDTGGKRVIGAVTAVGGRYVSSGGGYM
jgi:hypothetical protein